MSIFFSCVGNTDPFRNNYDGPMIHILRHYKQIDTCIIFLTDSMAKIHREKNYYQRAIQHIEQVQNRNIDVKFIETDIKNANDYDIFYTEFDSILKTIKEEYPNERVYCNITSGTPQMMSSLMLLICQEAFSHFIPIQVKGVTDKDKTKAVGTDHNAYNYEYEEENCIDNEPDAQNRCKESKITIYTKSKLATSMNSFLDTYQYSAAYELLKGYDSLNSKIGYYIQFLMYRQNFEFDKARNMLSKLSLKASEYFFYEKNIDLYSETNLLIQKMVETLIAIQNAKKTKHYNDFVIKVQTLTIILERELIYKFSNKKLSFRKKTSLTTIQNYSKKLYDEIMDKFKKINIPEPREELHLNIYVGSTIMNYFGKENSVIDGKIMDGLKRLEELVTIRNDAAHNFCSVNENDIQKIIDINSVTSLLIKLLKLLHPSFDQKYLKVYDKINEEIKRVLWED